MHKFIVFIGFELCRSNYEDHNIYEVREPLDLLKDLHFDPNLPTVIYAFGWTENPQSGSTRTIINSYIERGDWNVILLDWQTLARPFYPIAARNVRQVSLFEIHVYI